MPACCACWQQTSPSAGLPTAHNRNGKALRRCQLSGARLACDAQADVALRAARWRWSPPHWRDRVGGVGGCGAPTWAKYHSSAGRLRLSWRLMQQGSTGPRRPGCRPGRRRTRGLDDHVSAGRNCADPAACRLGLLGRVAAQPACGQGTGQTANPGGQARAAGTASATTRRAACPACARWRRCWAVATSVGGVAQSVHRSLAPGAPACCRRHQHHTGPARCAGRHGAAGSTGHRCCGQPATRQRHAAVAAPIPGCGAAARRCQRRHPSGHGGTATRCCTAHHRARHPAGRPGHRAAGG